MTRRKQEKKTARRRYSKEFKEEALALAERLGVPGAVKELGLHESQLYGLRMKARAQQNQSELERDQTAEIARLKRKMAEQAEKCEWFSKPAHMWWIARDIANEGGEQPTTNV